jgi:hypothetical protein
MDARPARQMGVVTQTWSHQCPANLPAMPIQKYILGNVLTDHLGDTSMKQPGC